MKPFPNIHILQKSYIILDKVVFIGCTLWSYLSKKDLIAKSKSLSKTMFIRYQDKILITRVKDYLEIGQNNYHFIVWDNANNKKEIKGKFFI